MGFFRSLAEERDGRMNKHQTTGRWRTGLALTLVATLMWGLLPLAMKGLLKSLDPVTITWFRFSVSGAVLAAVLLPRTGFRPRVRPGKLGILLLLTASLFLCGNYVLYVFGLEFLTPSAAQVVIQLAPLFLLLGGILVYRERFSLPQWMGVALFTLGLALFFNQRVGDLLFRFGEYALGVLLVGAAGLVWAVYALAQKQLLSTWTSGQVMLWIYLAGCLLLLPFSFPGRVPELGITAVLLLAFCSLNTLVAYGAFSEALNHWEASRVSAVLTTVPVVTLSSAEVVARVFPGFLPLEPLNALSVIGALLVVGGSMLTSLWRPAPVPASHGAGMER